MSMTRNIGTLVLTALLISGCGGESQDGSSKQAKEPTEVISNTLGITDPALLKEIYRLLESAVWREYGVIDRKGSKDVYGQAAKKVRSGGQLSSSDVQKMMAHAEKRKAARETREADDKAKGITHLLPRESLEKIFDIVKQNRPDLGGYKAKQLILETVRTIWPYTKSLYFKRLKNLVPPEGFRPPEVDEKYAHFFGIKRGYSSDAVFNELRKMKDDDLPDGATLPLLSLSRVPDTGLMREGYYELTDDAIVKRYGSRMYPALVEYLAHPEKYGLKVEGYPPVSYLSYAREWPDEMKKALQRQAFYSGWDDALRMLEGPYTAELASQFKDSPYGAPDRP